MRFTDQLRLRLATSSAALLAACAPQAPAPVPAAAQKTEPPRGAETHAVRHLLWRAADLLDRGLPCSAETSMAKLAASRLAVRATNEVVQLFGWRGIDERFGLEKRARDARVTTIYDGTSEIQRIVISRSLLEEN